MIYIGITNKMKEKFKLTLDSETAKEIERIDSWHANIFTFQRKTGAIIMNDLTRYSVILFGLKKADFENLNELMRTQLKKNMSSDGFDEIRIQKFIRNLDVIKFTKTNNRSVLGQIKDSLFGLSFYIDPDDLLTEEMIQVVNDRLNDTPMSALERDGYKPYPIYALKEVLK